MTTASLATAAARLSETLGDSCLLIGGMAVSAWGHVRATDNVDFASTVAPEPLLERLRSAGIEAELLVAADMQAVIPWVIRGTCHEMPFQVIAAPVAIDKTQAHDVPLSDGRSVRVVGLRDLIRLKLKAAGMHDLWDIAKLLKENPTEREWALAQAGSFGVAKELEGWLNDPRL